MVVGSVGSPSGSVSASNQVRVSGTSPTTGVTYTMIHSCMAQMPSAIASRPGADVFVKLEFVRDGVVVRDVNDRVDNRSDDNRLDFQRRDNPSSVGTDGISFRLRDVFVSEGIATFGPPFLTLIPEPCPDYADDVRGSFAAIAPTRTLDTRPGQTVNYSGPKPAAGSSVTIPAAVMPERPVGVLAVSLTVTMVQPDAGAFAQVYPFGATTPGAASNVNAPGPGVNIANGAVVPVAADGSVSVFTSGSSHLLVDINGYFVAQVGDVSAGRLETIDPKRVFDTRDASPVNSTGAKPAPGSTTTVDLTALSSGLPSGATAAVVNITVTRTTGPGFVQAAAAGRLEVGASSVLNVSNPGQSIAGLTIVPLSAEGRIDVYTLGGADVLVDLFGWFTGDGAEASSSGLFVPLTPERIFDSRRPTSMNPNTFTGDPGGCCSGSDAALGFASLQGRASAVFVNATAIARGETGFIRIGGSSASTFSTVNHASTGAIANAALVPLLNGGTRASMGSGGAARAAVVRPALAVDITGYFTL